MNGLHRGSLIQVGASLVIPGTIATAPGGSYTVGKGDSACGIATRYGINCEALLAANGLAKSDLIFPGQTLTVPGVAARRQRATGFSLQVCRNRDVHRGQRR